MVSLICGILFISLLGTLLHFTYDWSKKEKIIGLFSAVNESTWEHIKIALTPTFVWIVIELLFMGHKPNFIFANFISLLSLIIFIPLVFYGYKLFTKKAILVVDIMTFYIAIIVSRLLNYIIINGRMVNFFATYIGLIGIVIIFIFYLTFTVMPPKCFVFEDPVTKKYGIKKQNRKDLKTNKKKTTTKKKKKTGK